MKATVELRPEGDEPATELTIRRMAQFIREDAQRPIVRAAAHDAIRQLAARDAGKEAAAVFWWIKNRVRLVEDSAIAAAGRFADPDEAEVLIRPADLLAMRPPQGDCDDFSMLGAAMLRALGIDCRLATIAADPAAPDQYSHVYLVAVLPCGERMPLDISHGPRPAWSARAAGKTREWRIDDVLSRTLGSYIAEDAELAQITGAGGGIVGSNGGLASEIARLAAGTFSNIATARWGNPPPGTYVQTGPTGSTYYRQQPGSSPLNFPTVAAGGGGIGTLLIVVVVVGILIVLLKGRS